MSDAYKHFLSGSKNPKRAVEKIQYDIQFERDHPEFFHPDGFICFCGGQGSGKTLSASQYIHELVLRYPKVKIIANCSLHFPDWDGEVIRYEGYEQVQNFDNGYAGIILFLDEIHAEFNSLESKKIDPAWFTVISQQRKRRLHVVGTSQVFERVAKCWREQFTACIICRGWFGIIQYNRVVCLDDIEENDKGDVMNYQTSDTRIWFRDVKVYDYYDTWERVERKEDVTDANSRRSQFDDLPC